MNKVQCDIFGLLNAFLLDKNLAKSFNKYQKQNRKIKFIYNNFNWC